MGVGPIFVFFFSFSVFSLFFFPHVFCPRICLASHMTYVLPSGVFVSFSPTTQSYRSVEVFVFKGTAYKFPYAPRCFFSSFLPVGGGHGKWAFVFGQKNRKFSFSFVCVFFLCFFQPHPPPPHPPPGGGPFFFL